MTINNIEKRFEYGQVVDASINPLPHQLEIAIKHAYEATGMAVENAIREPESAEYGACRLEVDGQNIVFRVAKTTPIKIGKFVTIWRRLNDITTPFDSTDNVDLVVIDVSDSQNHGQFVFNRRVLIEKGIMSHNNKKGKMAIRIYPPWSRPVVKQAIKTQQWQLRYFFSFSPNVSVDKERICNLFNRNDEIQIELF